MDRRKHIKPGLAGLVLIIIGNYLVKYEPVGPHNGEIAFVGGILLAVGAFFFIGATGWFLLLSLGPAADSSFELEREVEEEINGHQSGEKIYEYDPNGNYIGYSVQYDDKVHHYDKNDKLNGYDSQYDDKVYHYDKNDKLIGYKHSK